MYRERRKTTTTQQQQQHQQQQGINWGLIAGGAVATVLSVAFSRSKKKQASNSSVSKNNAPVSLDSDSVSLRRESSSGSSSSKSEASEGDESFSVFNRSAVHKLRHQLKSRDQMIMQMQSQLSDKERALYSHKSLISKLEKQLEDANESIFEVERVIHELGDSATPPPAAATTPREVVKTAEFEEVVEEEDERSLVLHAKEGEYGMVFEKAKHLEAELVGIRAMAQEMSSLLELSERERLRLHHVVSQLQQKLAFQAKELSTLRATTHFLKLSLGSTRRSGNDVDLLSRLSKDDTDGLIQLNSSMSVFSNPQERYAGSDKLMEVADIDSSVKEDNLTSSSASSFPDLCDGADWADEQIAEFRTEDSPGVVRMGSPTIAGSRSVDGAGLVAARRYLFDSATAAAGTEDEEVLEVVVEEQKEADSSSSSPSVTDEKMLDDTLDDLVRATSSTGTIE